MHYKMKTKKYKSVDIIYAFVFFSVVRQGILNFINILQYFYVIMKIARNHIFININNSKVKGR